LTRRLQPPGPQHTQATPSDRDGCVLHTFGCCCCYVQRSDAQHDRALVPQYECSGIYCQVYTSIILYISLVYTMSAGHCTHCAPYPFVLEDPLEVPLEECWLEHLQLFITCH
jgi:hypothetical protein